MKRGWQTKKLGDLCRIRTGKKDVDSGNPGGEFPFFTCAAEHTFSDSYSFDTEALLIAGNGDVGRVSYYKGKFEAYQRTYVLSDFADILPRFLYLILDGKLKDTVSKQKPGNTMPYIKVRMLADFQLPVPPIPEQQRIVGILDEAFDGIATVRSNAQKNLQNARALSGSYLNSIFTQRGEGWVEKQLGEFCAFENGDRGTNYPSKSARTATGIPFINAGHLTDKGIDFETMDYISRQQYNLLGAGKIRAGDILFCLRGSLGKFASVGDLAEGAIASSLVIVRPDKSVLNGFVLAYFRSHLCADMINRFKGGAAQPNLSAHSLSKFLIPVAPLPVQRTIITKFDALSVKTQRIETIQEQKLAALDELKKSLLDQAFSGEL